ncbi:squalene synthase HpnC [Undibacterium sp. Jales W-56]|uniref:squalene synthase HpnC n=1 Tax=Undibacterium sp. Jales W-56 TaxID=2897325 RepID=UPI0021CE4A8B|nr:squalene synthase HpnC [Undibacterium sp. Jales W-56]MCU6433504.1 squalene synthase HpnC [Undibacterium sp. Jales W-56]
MSVEHYENFPVASLLLPARLRPAVEAIYAFARTADDIADEGDAMPEQRLLGLSQYETELRQIETSQPSGNPLFDRLHKVIQQYTLPMQAFRDLLSAFKQDVTTTRYNSYDDLLDYCKRSANPVGLLMLHLYAAATPENKRDSDAICSALQLINFWQDIAIDWGKQRVYVPLQDLIAFNIDEAQIANQLNSPQWAALMQFETSRTRTLLISGMPLCKRLPGRIGWELRLVVQGGLRILERIDAVEGDIFHRRPQLGKADWFVMLWRAIKM